MKKKKALFVCNNISIIKEKILPAIMVIMNKGYEIDVVTNEKEDIPFITNIYVLEALSNLDYNFLKKNVKDFQEILKTGNYDIVHTFDNYSSFLLKESSYSRIDTELFIYVEDLKNNYSRLKNIIKIAENVIVNNEEDYEYLKKKKLNENIKIIYDLAIDFRKYKEINLARIKEEIRCKYNLQNEKKYICIADTNGKETYIIKVLNEIAAQNSNVIFIVSDYNKKLIEVLNKNNSGNYMIIENIKWLEMLFLSDSVLITNLYSYDVMTFIYTLMFGIPVIIERSCISEKYIDELKNGYFVDNMNIQQTVLAIGRSINIPKVKVDELRNYNYNKISNYSIDKYAYHLSELYIEVTNNPPKDVYFIESLKKSIESERLMSDIKSRGAISAEIVVLEESVNDEKLKSLGAEIKLFRISNFNGKYKLKKYIEKVLSEKSYNSFTVYGKMQRIIKNNGINVQNDNMIVEYKKI